ncbi:hypothetical protein ACN38_g2064, partial [Penicillium nordicum]
MTTSYKTNQVFLPIQRQGNAKPKHFYTFHRQQVTRTSEECFQKPASAAKSANTVHTLASTTTTTNKPTTANALIGNPITISLSLSFSLSLFPRATVTMSSKLARSRKEKGEKKRDKLECESLRKEEARREEYVDFMAKGLKKAFDLDRRRSASPRERQASPSHRHITLSLVIAYNSLSTPELAAKHFRFTSDSLQIHFRF